MAKRSQQAPYRRRRILILHSLWIILNVGVYALGALEARRPLLASEAYSAGIERISNGHVRAGIFVELVILGTLLASARSLALGYRSYFHPSPIEVRGIENSTDMELNVRALDVAFREYLTAPRMYQVTAVPGDPEPDRLIEILRAPSYSGWRGLLAAIYGYVLPRRVFIVTAALRVRDEQPQYGVSAQVRRLPGYVSELESQ